MWMYTHAHRHTFPSSTQWEGLGTRHSNGTEYTKYPGLVF